MSGPFGVSLTVISGQKLSAEVAVAASCLLDMRFLYIDPVATASGLRPEFLNVLRIFRHRERLDPYTEPEAFVQRLAPPSRDRWPQSRPMLCAHNVNRSLLISRFI